MRAPHDLPWWQKTTVYQIYPRSFQDTTGNGLGDIPGIVERLDYLHDVGFETLWLCPIYESPHRDGGYDVSNFRAVDETYGTMADVEHLLAEAHAREMKIVFDLVLNHTSDQHPWFQASRSSRDDPKRDWYVWRDGQEPGGAEPPNNWRSLLMGQSGWHYDETTDQWYWAHFFPFQPDLNYRTPAVKAAMFDVMRFWLRKGVDGFRLDFINGIFEDAEFRDNPFKLKLVPSSLSPEMLLQGSKYTLDHPDTFDFVKELRAVLDEFTDPPRFLVGEAVTGIRKLRLFCGGDSADGLNMVFLFESLGAEFAAPEFATIIEKYNKWFADPLVPTWVFSTHDRMRRITRLKNDFARGKLNALLQLTARGVPFVYYGEEIGLPQHDLPADGAHDPVARHFSFVPELVLGIARKYFDESLNRDECRSPMQWSDAPHAGFCPPDADPWIPVTPPYKAINVARERDDPASMLTCYRQLLHLRRAHPALHAGTIELIDLGAVSEQVLGYCRAVSEDEDESTAGESSQDRLHVFLNFAEDPVSFPAPRTYRRCLFRTTSADGIPCAFAGEDVTLQPLEGIILEC